MIPFIDLFDVHSIYIYVGDWSVYSRVCLEHKLTMYMDFVRPFLQTLSFCQCCRFDLFCVV